MVTRWLQVLLATTINRARNSLPCGMAMGYLRQPGNPCPSLYNDGNINPIFRSYLVENNEGPLLTRAATLSQRKTKKSISLCQSTDCLLTFQGR